MVIDAAMCGVPSLSYFPLNNEVLQRRKYKFQLDDSGRPISIPSLPVATNHAELNNLASIILTDSSLRSKLINQVINDWHYPSVGFEQLLTLSVFNELLGAVQ